MPASRRRSIGMVAAALAVLAVLAAAALLAVSWVATANKAKALQAEVAATRTALSAFDTTAATASLQRSSVAAAGFREATEGFAWQVAERTPFIADTARAASAFAVAAEDLAAASLPLVTAVDGQASTIGKVMAVLGRPQQVADVRAAAQRAADGLAGVAPDGLRFGVGESVASAQEALPGLVSTLDGLSSAAGPLGSMLGKGEPATWLVMSQNPAELRGSGGLFNAYLIVTLTDGNLEIVEAGSRKQLDRELPRTEQIPYWGAVDPGTASTWGPVLGEWASFNIPADFPTVARLAAAGMAQRGTPVDGVVAIDPVVIAAILAGTGPVEHKGITIDAANAAGFFTQRIYESFPGFEDAAAKDELAMGLTYATIDAATKRPLDGASLLPALRDALDAGHVKAWSSNEADEGWLMTTPVAGALRQHPDEFAVAFTNATGGKLDPYVTRDVTIDYGSCATDKSVGVTVAMDNQSPTGLPAYVDVTLDQEGQPDPAVPSGFTRTYVTVYGTGTAQDDAAFKTSATLDGTAVDTWFGSTDDRPVWTVPVELQRGESAELAMTFTVTSCPRAEAE
ncbi:MAG: DUF4012 domain-containing protein [Candidatus Nanopelagicales bacterium]